MKAFIFKALAYLIAFALGTAVISMAALELLGNLVPRNILDGFMMGTIVIVAGTIGGKLGNEFKAMRNGARQSRNK